MFTRVDEKDKLLIAPKRLFFSQFREFVKNQKKNITKYLVETFVDLYQLTSVQGTIEKKYVR